MRSRYDGHSVSTRGIGVDIKGDGTTASLEVGKPLLRFGSSAWQLEPQLQMIWQQTAIDDTSDSFAVLRMDNDDSWTARVGLRLSGDYTLADNGWQPYAKLNYWQAVSGEDRIDIGGDPLTSEQAYRALEIGVLAGGRFIVQHHGEGQSLAAGDLAAAARELAEERERDFQGAPEIHQARLAGAR